MEINNLDIKALLKKAFDAGYDFSLSMNNGESIDFSSFEDWYEKHMQASIKLDHFKEIAIKLFNEKNYKSSHGDDAIEKDLFIELINDLSNNFYILHKS